MGQLHALEARFLRIKMEVMMLALLENVKKDTKGMLVLNVRLDMENPMMEQNVLIVLKIEVKLRYRLLVL